MTGCIRVIAHEATRSGATIVLLALLRHATEAGVEIEVEVVRPGPLLADFDPWRPTGTPRAAPSAVLANGSAAAPALLDHPGVPTAVYVHEDGDALRALSADARRALLAADRVLCVSHGVRDQLAGLGVPEPGLCVLPPVIGSREPVAVDAIASARRAIGVAADSALIVGCGAPARLKGADLFVEMAGHLAELDHYEFAWIGWRSRRFSRLLDHDVSALGLNRRFHWTGEVADPFAILAAANVLVSTSRRDAQPLVPLEAALAGTPTAGFAVGGLVDLADRGAARTVPYPDAAALAAVVRDLTDGDDGRDVVAAARRRATEEQSIEVLGPRFVAELEALRDSTPSRHGADLP